MGTKSQDNDYLKIGDLVTFKSVEFDSFICSEGILVEDVYVSKDYSQFDSCLFAIHLQRKYSAFKELQNYIRINNVDLANTDDQEPAARKYLQALIRGKENEKQLNDTYMRDKSGQCILFGDIIQLFHVKSRKYVKVLNGKLAKGERENMKISLDIQGDSYSWFQVMPRYRIDREGDRIPTGTELFLKVVEKPGEYLHCAHRMLATASTREVNCALESTSWRASIYQSSLDARDPVTLLCSQLVYINDPEKNANLTIGRNKAIGLDDQSIYAGTPDNHIHKYGDIVLEPIQENKSASSASLWCIESKKLVTGGPIAWKTQQVRIKNLNTGLYLLSVPIPHPDDPAHLTESVIWTTTDNFMLPGTLFNVEELLAGANDLGVGRTIKIHQKGIYFECQGDVILEDKSYAVQATREADKAVSFKLFRYVETEEGSIMSSGSSADNVAGGSDPMDVYVSVAARNYLRQYLHMIRIPTKIKGASSIWPNSDDSEMEFFHAVVEKMIWFSQGQPISSTAMSDLSNPAKQMRRQLLLMEQGLVEVILRIVHRLIPITERSAKSLPEEKFFLESGSSVLSRCLGLLLACIKDNTENQMFVADHMPVLLAHLGSQELAGECVTEMLAKNYELQETKIGSREISIFVNKLRESRMNSMYLQLLTACCSCEGNGVDGNQCKVTNMIFEGKDTEDIVIRIVPTPDAERLPHSWNDKSLYIPQQISSEAPMKATELLTSLPQLMLTFKAANAAPQPGSVSTNHYNDPSNTSAAASKPTSKEGDRRLSGAAPSEVVVSHRNSGKFQLRSRTPSSSGDHASSTAAAAAYVSSVTTVADFKELFAGSLNEQDVSGDELSRPVTGNVAFEGSTELNNGDISRPSTTMSSYKPRQLPPIDPNSKEAASRPTTTGKVTSSRPSTTPVKTQPGEVPPEELTVAAAKASSESGSKPNSAEDKEKKKKKKKKDSSEDSSADEGATDGKKPAAKKSKKASVAESDVSDAEGKPAKAAGKKATVAETTEEAGKGGKGKAAEKGKKGKAEVKAEAIDEAPTVEIAKQTSISEALVPPPTASGSAPGRLTKAVSFSASKYQPPFVSGSLDENGYYRYDVLTLYGNDMGINVKDEFALASVDSSAPNRNSTAADGTNGANASLAVATYFISQVFLGAEMCLDRNYVAMHTLDERFPYEVLVTLVRLDISEKLKAAACRMLLCLHVDRDPQASFKIPSLSRSWKAIDVTSTPEDIKKLPSVDKFNVNQFALLQEAISEHVKTMSARRWGDLSRHMLVLLKKLVYFNFYNNTDKLNDVIVNVIAALNRKEAERDYETTVASKSTRGNISSSQGNRSGRLTMLSGKTGKDNSGVADMSGAGENSFGNLETNDGQHPLYITLNRLLEFMESFPVMLSVLALVIVAVTLAIYETLEVPNAGPGSVYFLVNNIILAIFIIEVSIRAFCFRFVRGTLIEFVCDVFNVIDIVVILIDLVFLGMPPSISAKGKYAKSLRLVRLLRLLRLLRAARVMGQVRGLAGKKGRREKWKAPLRYVKTTANEIATMLEGVDILARCQQIIEDRNLTLLLKAFNDWQSGKTRESPGSLFEQVVKQSERDLTLGVSSFNDVFIDMLMFSSNSLVQRALELLMSHHSTRKSLLHNASVMQLMISPKHEKLFSTVDSLLQQLERNAETHELWGELASESDRKTNEQTKSILIELCTLCRVRRYVFDVDGEFAPDKDTQDLYHNLGCFQICLKVLALFDSVDDHYIPSDDKSLNSLGSMGSGSHTGELLDEAGQNILELCKLCNSLLYWFFWMNPRNQELGFEELPQFLEMLDTDVDAHLVIESILKGNEKLMRLVPHSHLFDLAEKIVGSEPDERSYRDLYLFYSITNVGDINIKENQLEIIKQLCSPGRLPLVSCFFVPVDSEEYAKKIELMEGLEDSLENRDLDMSRLPPLLAYHVTLMSVLSRCTIGRYNITTVEAKVQSIFKADYLLDSILDPRTILVVKIKQCQLMLNCMIDVEMQIPGFEFNASIWKFFEIINTERLAYAKDEIRLVEKQGWAEPEVSRHRVEYLLICIQIINAFFRKYYGAEKFKVMDGAINNTNRVQLSFAQIDGLIVGMFNKIKDVYDLDSPRLSVTHKAIIYDCTLALNNAAVNVIVTDLPKTHLPAAVAGQKADANSDLDAYADPDVIISRKYQEFVSQLESDDAVKKSIAAEEKIFCEILDSLPSIDGPSSAASGGKEGGELVKGGDVQQQRLYMKLVTHIRENLRFVNRERRLDGPSTKTAIFIIKSFRTIIENRMKMTIAERDEMGGDEQDEAAAPAIKAMNETGSTAVCLDLIAAGLEPQLVLESIYLIVAMLFKEGGAIAIQSLINKHLKKTDSFLLFKQMRITIKRLIAYHEFHGIVVLKEDEEVKLMDEMIVMRFMQLMCEGHYLPNQDILREQPTNSQQFNLLDDYVQFLNCLSKLHCRTSTVAAIAVANVILEVIQGPCKGNQFYFAMETELLEIINRLLRSGLELDCVREEEVELKKVLIDILQGLVEGQSGESAVYDRVISVVHLEIVLLLANGGKSIHAEQEEEGAEAGAAAAEGSAPSVAVDGEAAAATAAEAGEAGTAEGGQATATAVGESAAAAAAAAEEEEITEEERILRAECMVFINMMCDYKPSLRADLKLDKSGSEDEEVEENPALQELSESTVSVEILWAGDLQRRYFYVPSVCKYIAKTSMDRLVQTVNRSNNEAKLKDFILHLKQMYREVKHQQTLNELGLSSVFNQINHSRATWGTFYLACIVNLLYLAFANYSSEDDDNPDLNDKVDIATTVLSILQIIIASFTVILSIVVRSPVEYAAQMEATGEKVFTSIVRTALEPMTIYYIGYLAFAVLGLTFNPFFNTLLLLDLIVKNATCKNVLMAAYLPREALIMAAILGLFCMYIFAFFTFFFLRDEMNAAMGQPICLTLWGCMKFYMGQALLAGGGVGDFMDPSLGVRIVLDICFFIVITVILLNVIFGIIIDTFSALRFEKDEREDITVNYCFVCGIEKVIFDRAEGNSEGFNNHIKNDHFMWNYMKFIFHIWEQDRDDDDGLEQFVRQCIEKKDITWFPMNKALKLSQADTAMDILQRELYKDITTAEAQLAENLKNLQIEANVVLTQLKSALRNDFSDVGAKVGIGRALLLMSRQMAARPTAVEELEDNEEDEELDENGQKTKRSEDPDSDLGKHIFLTIESVSGFGKGVSAEELAKASCCIVCDINMYSVKCDAVKNNAMLFKMADPLLVCSNAESGDDRRCLVQVLDMQGMFGMVPSTPNTPHSMHTPGKCFGKVEFEMDELINAANTSYSKALISTDETNTESNMVIVVRPTFVAATEVTADL